MQRHTDRQTDRERESLSLSRPQIALDVHATRVAGLVGVAQLLQQSALTLEQRQLAEDIQIASTNLMDIVYKVMDFSKLEHSIFKV